MEINKEFIPYEQALALKELGFDEPCLAVYQDPDFLLIHNLLDSGWDREEMISVTNHKYASNGFVTTPLYQQVFRWFREKYELDSSIALVANGYGFYIHKNRNYTNKGESYGMYITYEEAELECLVKLIDIVKKQNLKG